MEWKHSPQNQTTVESRERVEKFFIEEVSLERFLDLYQTPFYITSLSAIEDRVKVYRKALKKYFPKNRIFYALKANWGVPVIEAVRGLGEGFDIVSQGELDHLLKLGVDPASICFAGVGKKHSEIEAALRSGVGILNIEHLEELQYCLGLMKTIPSNTRIALRLNPALEIETHPHLRTGALDSKFGILAQALLSFFEANQHLKTEWSAQGKPLLESVSGIHVHVGSQLLSGMVFKKLVAAVAEISEDLYLAGIRISHLDFGGGLGVPLSGVPESGEDVTHHVDDLFEALKKSCAEKQILQKLWGENFESVQVCLEPGRSIVASSTVFATEVLYTRENGASYRFAFVDGGMNDFPRPSIYGATHDVILGCRRKKSLALDSATAPRVQGGPGLQIVGPVCESGDVLRKDAPLESVVPGDVILFLEAGAYCRSMASEYNLRKLPHTFYVRGAEIVTEGVPLNSVHPDLPD